MTNKIRLSLYYTLLFLFISALGSEGIAQDTTKFFMSPFEPDSNTVVLMHFDGNTDNASPLDVENGVGHGSVNFPTSDVSSAFNRMLYLDNDEIKDSSYVHIPDTTALDMTGNWTMEGWVFIRTYGRTTDSWRWRPKLMVKPGEETRSYSNYYNNILGDDRFITTGYFSHSGGNWFAVRTADNTFQAGKWYHVAHIRDTTNNLLVQVIHDKNGELLYFTNRQYDPSLNHPPNTTDMPIYIGINLGQGGGWLDGFLDEFRLSNTIRDYSTPPILTNLSNPANKEANESAQISVNANILGGNTIQSTTLHYRVNEGSWQSESMAKSQDGMYTAEIPGQSAGSAVEYYVTSTADNGLKASNPEDVSDTTGTYPNYAVVADSTHIMHLSFEGGEGTPQNQTSIDLPITAHGNPTYGDGANGTQHSIYLEGDSSYLAVETPSSAFLRSKEFVVDFWMKSDTVPGGSVRYLIKQGRGNWSDFNYQVWASGNGGAVIPAVNVPPQGKTGNITGLGASIEGDKWYHVEFIVQTDTAYSRLYDAQDNLIGENGGAITGDTYLSNGPLYIGAYDPALDDLEEPFGEPDGPFFGGHFDEVKMFNYVPSSYTQPTSIENPGEIPQRVTLEQNYPNPFNPATRISYSLPEAKDVLLTVYDVTGREVATLVDEKQQAGDYTVKFNAEDLASGVYFYQISTEDYTRVRKMLLLK